MSFDIREWQVAPGNWNRINEIFGLLGVQEVPSLKVTGGGVIDRNTDVTSDTFGEITLNYDTIQFDESPAGTFHIQHFHTEDTKRTCVGVDTEDGSGQSDTLVGHDVGSGSVVGFNTLVGAECGKTITDGFTNTGVGCLTFSAMDGNVARNTALGYYNQLNLLSRNNYTSACGNTSMGAFCCSNLVTGLWNTGMGYYALEKNKYGHGNFGIGAHAFRSLNSTERVITAFADAGGGQVTVTTDTTDLSNGNEVRITATDNYDGAEVIANVTGTTFEITHSWDGDDATGYVTLETEGCYNIGIGLAVGYSLTTGGLNVFIGNRSGYSNVTGSYNVFLGNKAGYNETGSDKLYIENSDSANPLIYGEFDNDLVKINGQFEVLSTSTQLQLNYDGSNNATFAVSSAGDVTIDATANIIVGTDLETDRWLQKDANTLIGVDVAGAGNLAHAAGSEGWYNTAIGYEACYASTTGNNNTAIGYQALKANTTGINNVALGSTALAANIDGDDNLAMGRSALNANTTGSGNTGIGRLALYSNTTGDSNTAIGRSALTTSTTASNNTAIGNNALQFNEGGIDNTAIGATALITNVGGNGNIGIGRSSLYNNTEGDYNTAVGRSCALANTTGNYNTMIGREANRYNQTGSNNVIIGYNAGRGTANHNKSGNVFIGYQAGYSEGGSNKLYIENSNSATPLIYGEFDNNFVRIHGDLELLDNSQIELGTGKDAIIYYDAADLIIDTDVVGTGSLKVNGFEINNAGELGDAVFFSGGGLCYGEISAVGNAVETVIAVAGTKVQITIFDTNGPSNNATPDHTNDHITITKAGDYFIAVSATISPEVAAVSNRFEMTVQKNNGAAVLGALYCEDNLVGGIAVETEVISMSGIATLAVNDTIEVWVENEVNTDNYLIENITLTLMQIGG